MIYSVPMIKTLHINQESKDTYLAGTKICSNAEDHRLLIAYIKQFNLYLRHGKDLDQTVTMEFHVRLKQGLNQYEAVEGEQKVSINMSVTQKDGNKFLCILVKNKLMYIKKIDLEVFIAEVEKFNKKYNDNHSFKICYTSFETNDQFLIEIGELISPLSEEEL